MQIIANKRIADTKKSKFAFWFVFSLILNGYATGIPGISLGSAVFLILVIMTLTEELRNDSLIADTRLITFGAVITFTSCIGMCVFNFLYPSFSLISTSQISGIAKFWMWLLMTSVVAIKYYNQIQFTKWLTVFSAILTIYIIMQTLAFYGAGVFLPNIFDFGPLKPYAEGYADYDRLSRAGVLRPAGFLSESSFYGNFILCTTVLYLEKNISKITREQILFILFLCLGIVFSGSTSAILYQAFVIFIYFRKLNSNVRWQVGLLAILLILVIGTLWIEGINDSFLGNSLEYAFNKFYYLDSSTRFGKSYAYLEYVPNCVRWIGAGLGTDYSLIKEITGLDQIYLNSLTSLIIQSGLLGCFMFFILGVLLLRIAFNQQNTVSWILLIKYYVGGFGGGIYFSTYGILYMFIIIGQIETYKIIKRG